MIIFKFILRNPRESIHLFSLRLLVRKSLRTNWCVYSWGKHFRKSLACVLEHISLLVKPWAHRSFDQWWLSKGKS